MGLMRLILAIFVVIAHSHSIFGFTGIGGAAVQAFFVISGYYMSLVLGSKYTARGGLWLFYSNRLLRIFPLYWTVLLTYLLLAAIQRPDAVGGTFVNNIFTIAQNSVRYAFDGTWSSLPSLVPNFLILGAEIQRLFLLDVAGQTWFLWKTGISEGGNIRGGYQYLVMPQVWSLSVELAFYAIAPFLARTSLRYLFGILALSALLQAAVPKLLPGQGWLNLTIPHNFVYFLLGFVAYRISSSFAGLGRVAALSLAAIPYIIAVGWQGLWLLFVSIPSSVRHFVPFDTLVFAFFALGIIPLFKLTKDSTLDRRLGDLSYPVYLCHMLFAWPATFLGEWSALVAAIASCVFAYVLLRVVDDRIEDWRQWRVRRSLRPESSEHA
jgi:peptidoglycan/LPS O-acetylase OafA/YrhL